MDHYSVLGLPSGEEGARLSGEEITRAYRSKAIKLHPDKRPNDPHAHANFIQLQASYHFLRDETKRNLFDEQSRKRDRLQHQKINTQINQSQTSSSKRRRDMVADLRAREEEAKFKADSEKDAMISRKLKEEIANIVAKNISTKKKKKTITKQGTTAESSRNHAEVFSYNNYPCFAEYQAFEDSVLEKLKTAAQRHEQTQT